MESRHLRSRRTTQEIPDPSSSDEESLTPCNGNNNKISDIDRTLAKNTRIGLQKHTLKKDRKSPKNKPLIPGPEAALIKKEAISIGSFCHNMTSLKLSTDSKSIDTPRQKPPPKLAPLELPAQVKEAQMKKITTMADNVYVSERKPPHQRLHTPYQCPTKSDPSKMIRAGESKLPRLPEDVSVSKDSELVKQSSGRTSSLPRDVRLGGSGLSMGKAISRQMNESKAKTLSPKTNEGREVRSTRCPRANNGPTWNIPVNGPVGDYTEIRTIRK